MASLAYTGSKAEQDQCRIAAAQHEAERAVSNALRASIQVGDKVTVRESNGQHLTVIITGFSGEGSVVGAGRPLFQRRRELPQGGYGEMRDLCLPSGTILRVVRPT